MDEELVIIGGQIKCKCGSYLHKIETTFYYCPQCDVLYGYKNPFCYKIEVPTYLLNKRVFSINNRNNMLLKVGFVTEVDHLHVKVKFDEGQSIWIHHNNVRELFEEGL